MKNKVLAGAALGLAVLAQEAIAGDEVVAEEKQRCGKESLEGLYFGVGIGYDQQRSTVGDVNFVTTGRGGAPFQESMPSFEHKGNTVIGTVVLGYGGFIGNSAGYVGAEALVDLSNNSEGRHRFGHDNYHLVYQPVVSLKHMIVRPSLRLRLGCYFNSVQGMGYLMIGGVLSRVEAKIDSEWWNDCRYSLTKLAPVVGLGFEKAFCRSLTLRLEGDYRFRSTRNEKWKTITPYGADLTCEHRLRTDGFAIRLMASYHI